jgi:hypothetical protein
MSNRRHSPSRPVSAARVARLAYGDVGGPEAAAAQLASQLVQAEHGGDNAAVGRLCAEVTSDRALAIAVLMRMTWALASLAGDAPEPG